MTDYTVVGPRSGSEPSGSGGTGATRSSSGDRPIGSGDPPKPRGVPRVVPIVDPGRGPLPGGSGGIPTPGSVSDPFSEQGRLGGAVAGPDVLPLVYGTQLVQGRQIAYKHSSTWNRAFVVFAAGEIDSIVQLYDGENLFTASEFYLVDTYTGGVNQAACTDLNAWYMPYYSSTYNAKPSFRFPGVAYIHASAYQLNAYSGYKYPVERLLPTDWKAKIKGLKIRTSFSSETRTYSENPVWIVRDLLTNENAAGLPDSIIHQPSFETAAAICAETVNGFPRYTLNIALAAQQSAKNYIEAIRAHFAADIYFEDGQVKIWVDGPRTASGISFDTTNSRDFSLWEESTIDKPTKVTIEFPDASKLYAYNEVTSEIAPSNSVTDVRESRYTMEGIVSGSQAKRIATYILRSINFSKLHATFIASPVAAKLSRGDVISVSSTLGLDGQLMTVTGLTRIDNGEFTVYAKEYDPSVFSSDPYADDTPVSVTPSDFTTAIPSYTGSAALGRIFWSPPRINTAQTYASSYWTNSGFPTFNANALNDNNYTTLAFDDRFTASAHITLDCGIPEPMGTFRVVSTDALPMKFNLSNFRIQYSDDNITFYDLANPATDSDCLLQSTGIVSTELGTLNLSTYDMPAVGEHRYWRILKAATAAPGATDVYEFCFYSFVPDDSVLYYEVWNQLTTPAELVATIPAASVPSKATPLYLPSAIINNMHKLRVYAVTKYGQSNSSALIFGDSFNLSSFSDAVIIQPLSGTIERQEAAIGITTISTDILSGPIMAKLYFLAGS